MLIFVQKEILECKQTVGILLPASLYFLMRLLYFPRKWLLQHFHRLQISASTEQCGQLFWQQVTNYACYTKTWFLRWSALCCNQRSVGAFHPHWAVQNWDTIPMTSDINSRNTISWKFRVLKTKFSFIFTRMIHRTHWGCYISMTVSSSRLNVP